MRSMMTGRLRLLTFLPLFLAACGLSETENKQLKGFHSRADGIVPETGPEALFAASKLREYCKACHAVGSMRFIWSDSDQDLWTYILTNKAPNRQKYWSESIVEVLSWPAENSPPTFPIMDPPTNRDWMPKGLKREVLAAERLEGVPVRTVMLKALREGRSENKK